VDRFLAEVAHDLRQPLSVIEACTGLLLRVPLPARARQLVQQIQTAARRIADLGDELAMGGGEISREAFDLALLVDAHCRDILMTHAGRTMEVDVRQAIGRWDRRRVSRIVQNLLENALAHGEPDGLVLVSCGGSGGQAWLSVENRCPEIAPDHLAELFQPFHRGGLGGRAGLGLHIARELARAHGGELTASWSGGWIAFRLLLPAAVTEPVYTTPRRHSRALLDSELEVAAGQRVFWVRGRDISRGGIAFVSDVELSVSEQIKLAVYSDGASFSVLGTVRHVEHAAGDVRVGVEFAGELSTAEVDILKKRRDRPS
jgi:hypothetical protein